MKLDASGDACVPDCASQGCGEDDGCGGQCMASCTNLLHAWSEGFGGTGSDYARAVAVDGAGRIVVVGDATVPVDFDEGAASAPEDGGNGDIFVASFEADGSPRWSKVFGRSNVDQGFDVAIDSEGNITITGHVTGPMALLICMKINNSSVYLDARAYEAIASFAGGKRKDRLLLIPRAK